MAVSKPHIGAMLLAVGLSASATLAVCMLCIPTWGPAGRISASRARELSATASNEPPIKPTSLVILPINDVEPQLSQANNTWGYNGKCVHARDDFTPTVNFLLTSGECELSKITFKGVACVFTLIVASFAGLTWHISHCMKDMINPFLREMSLAVIVFNIFHNPHLPRLVADNPFICTCWLLGAEASVVRLIDYCKHRKKRMEMQEKWDIRQRQTHTVEEGLLKDVQGQDPNGRVKDTVEEGLLKDVQGQDPNDRVKDPNDLSNLKVVNRYQQMSTRFASAFFLFVGQFALGTFYIYSLNRKNGWSNSSGLRWFIGLLVITLADSDQAGYAFHFPFWLKLIGNKKQMEGDWGESEHLAARGRVCLFSLSYKNQARLRMFMSIIVNLYIRRIIFCTAPILLGIADTPLDFIKDSLAVLFITKLDDLDDPVNFLTDLKKKAKYEHRNTWWFFVFGTDKDVDEELQEDDSEASISAMERRIEKRMEKLEKMIRAPEQK